MKKRQTSGLWMILSGAALMLTGIYESVFGERKTSLVELAHKVPANMPSPNLAASSASAPTEVRQPEYFSHQAGWSRAKPESLPSPTYTPVMMAFGIVFLALGLVTKWYVAIVGVTVFFISVGRWIGELRND